MVCGASPSAIILAFQSPMTSASRSTNRRFRRSAGSASRSVCRTGRPSADARPAILATTCGDVVAEPDQALLIGDGLFRESSDALDALTVVQAPLDAFSCPPGRVDPARALMALFVPVGDLETLTCVAP